MIKSFIILILLIVLSAGLFLTRPTKDDFGQYIKQQTASSTGGGLFGKVAANIGGDMYLDSCTYKDKFLWTEIHRDGKPMFYGVFGHWWGSDASLKPVAKSA